MNDELQLSNETQQEQQDHLYKLNRFMSSVLGSMADGIAVVDADFNVVTWNARAEDLWGLRADEVQGLPLFSLDIGLPLEPLRPLVRRQLTGEDEGPTRLKIDAVNRRGRAVQVQVTATRLSHDGSPPLGAMIVMDAQAVTESE